MKDKFLSIVLHPLFISLILVLIIIYFLPDYFTRYKVDLVEQRLLGKDWTIYFEDMDGDYESESIFSHKNASFGRACFEVWKLNGDFVDQFNMNSYYPKTKIKHWFYDADHNGCKEVYTITYKSDSAFLNIIEPLKKDGIDRQDIFIDKITPYKDTVDFIPGKIFLTDIDDDGINELLFSLNCGFGGNPRNIYKYDFVNDSISKSPHLTNTSGINQIVDINDDGYDEIITGNYAAGNAIDTTYTKRSDRYTWLNILDHDLNFLFAPVKINSSFSGLYSYAIKRNGKFLIICGLDSKRLDESSDRLLVFDFKGKLTEQKELSPGNYMFLLDSISNNLLLYNRDNGEITRMDSNLNTVNRCNVISKNTLIQFSINDNNMWLGTPGPDNIVSIYRNDFSNPVNIQLPYSNINRFLWGIKQIEKNKNQIYFQLGDHYFVYDYHKNPLYAVRYLIYLGIFAGVLGLVTLIMKLQKVRMKKQLAIEQKIAELQIKAIKNQVDPHFVFNAINTISEMTLMNNKLEADNFICQFSDFMRSTLYGSDKIIHTLKDELDYVENYVKLQQIRYNNRFDYQITNDKKVNLLTLVPKHIIYSYVENAIKHGLANKTEQGFLKLSAAEQKDGLLLTIEDNGTGIKEKTDKKISTGSGMKIMEQMFKLYTKLYRRKIMQKLTELVDDQGKKCGIKVEITIEN